MGNNIENLNEENILDEVINPELIVEPNSILDSFNFKSRCYFLTEEIGSCHSTELFKIIRFWNDIDEISGIPVEDRDPIKIYINTPGGDLEAALSIINAIQTSRTPVYTISIGTSYSSGFFIGICGHKRFGLPYSSYLFHEGEVMDGGDAHKYFQRASFYKKELETIKTIVIKNTQIKEEEYENHRKDDWFMTAEEALKYGIIDEILKTF